MFKGFSASLRLRTVSATFGQLPPLFRAPKGTEFATMSAPHGTVANFWRYVWLEEEE
jgi:hypothetical protein